MTNIIDTPVLKDQFDSFKSIEKYVNDLISKKCLDDRTKGYFGSANTINLLNQKVDSGSSFNIAKGWYHLTKHFLHTSISSLGLFSSTVNKKNIIDDITISILQTANSVISDDLNNTHAGFSSVAPIGPMGAHYNWWRHDIVEPLAELTGVEDWANDPLPNGCKLLLENMKHLESKDYGFIIQLRVVEAIALNIAISFRDVFSHTFHGAEKTFGDRKNLDWIYSHIKVESEHHQQVSGSETAVTRALVGKQYFNNDIVLSEFDRYVDSWALALADFDLYLSN